MSLVPVSFTDISFFVLVLKDCILSVIFFVAASTDKAPSFISVNISSKSPVSVIIPNCLRSVFNLFINLSASFMLSKGTISSDFLVLETSFIVSFNLFTLEVDSSMFSLEIISTFSDELTELDISFLTNVISFIFDFNNSKSPIVFKTSALEPENSSILLPSFVSIIAFSYAELNSFILFT